MGGDGISTMLAGAEVVPLVAVAQKQSVKRSQGELKKARAQEERVAREGERAPFNTELSRAAPRRGRAKARRRLSGRRRRRRTTTTTTTTATITITTFSPLFLLIPGHEGHEGGGAQEGDEGTFYILFGVVLIVPFD
jgi:hypothetical protein